MLEIQKRLLKSSDYLTSQGKPVIQSQIIPNTEFCSLFASANSPKISKTQELQTS